VAKGIDHERLRVRRSCFHQFLWIKFIRREKYVEGPSTLDLCAQVAARSAA
jgi:hypothetical protein